MKLIQNSTLVRRGGFKIQNFIITPILFLAIIFLFSCTSGTDVSKGSLTGTVSLEGLSDYSNISVSLYDLAYLDTTIVRINNQYPHIGVIINQHTEFDHRLQSPVATSATAADGSFLIEDVPTGSYNFVAQKAGYGFRYIYEISISQGENSLSEVRSDKGEVKSGSLSHLTFPLSRGDHGSDRSGITLYPEIHRSGDVNDNIIVAPFHHLVCDDDVTFTPGSSLEIQPNAVVRIAPGADLKIMGNFKAQGEENNMFWVTSNDGFADNSKSKMDNVQCTMNNDGDGEEHSSFFILHSSLTKRDSLAYYNSMSLEPTCSVSDDLIEWGKWSWGNTCLLNKVNNLHLENGIFSSSLTGIAMNEIIESYVMKTNVIQCTGESSGGILIENQNSGLIEHNIVIDNFIGISVKNLSNPLVKNNYIINCIEGILVSYASSPQLVNNDIDKCEYGIKTYTYYGGYPCNPIIEYNNINAERCLYFGKYNVEDVHFNNMFAGIWAIQLFIGGTPQDFFINAENNYYFTVDEDEIKDLIFDKNDVSTNQQDLTGLVYYEPFLIEKSNNAGIEE